MKRYLSFFAITLLLASCSKSDAPGNNNTGNQMRFTASVPVEDTGWNRATRGQVIGSTNIADFGAFCFNTGRTPWATAAATALPNKMFDVEVLRTPSTSNWVYNPPVAWEGGDAAMFTFFGYSPRAKGIYHEPDNSQGNNIEVLSTATDPDIPRLSYTTLDYVPMQIDLLVAKPVYNTYPVDRVRMQFTHALSQIRFKAWAVQDFVRVTSIEISNIKHTATLSLDGTITAGAGEKTFVLDNINRSLSTDELNPTDLSDGSNAFLLLPQDLTANTTAQITVTYHVGVEEKTSKPYTIIQNWEPNKSYTYLLSLGGNPTEEMVITSVTMTDWVVDSEEDMSTTPPPSPPADQAVEINGLWWATGNLVADGANGAKIGKIEDAGLHFQFGSLVGWKGGATGNGTARIDKDAMFYAGSSFNATNEVQLVPVPFTKIADIGTTWPSQVGNNLYYFGYNAAPYATNHTNIHSYPGLTNGSLADNGVGDPCRYYLGDPWRVPTDSEFQAMNDAATSIAFLGSWVEGSTDSYLVYTFPGNVELRLPPVGHRELSTGKIHGNGSYSYYWSSSIYDSNFGNAWYAQTSPTGNHVANQIYSNRTSGFSVRCVSSTAP